MGRAIAIDDLPDDPTPVRQTIAIDDLPDDAHPIPAPGKSDVAVPKPAVRPDRASIQYNIPETGLMHFAHGVAGDLPNKAAAAITAGLGIGPEETFGQRYDAALSAEHRREEQSAKQNPFTAGTSEVLGTAAPFVAGAGLIKGAPVATGATLSARMLALAAQAARAGVLGGVQGATKDGVSGAVQGAAFGAAAPALGAAKALPYVGKVLAAAPVAANTYFSGRTLIDPNATAAQKIEAGENMLAPALFHAAGRGERRAQILDPQRQVAESDLMAPGGPVEQRVRENGRTLQEAQAEDAAHYDKLVREADARKQATQAEFEKQAKAAQTGAEAVNTELTATERRRMGEQRKAVQQAEGVNREVDAVLGERRAEADKSATLAKIGRERAYDQEVAAVEGRNADARTRFDAAMRDWQTANEAAKAHAEAEKGLRSDAAAEAKRLAAVTAEHEKRTTAFHKATQALNDELASLEAEQEGLGRSADASWAKKHADAQAHIAGFLRVADLAQQEIPPELMARMRRLAGHLADVREDNAPVRFNEYEKLASQTKGDYAEQYAREHGAENAQRIDAIKNEMQGRAAPTRDAAEQAIADRGNKTLSDSDKARLLAFVKSRGGDLGADGSVTLPGAPPMPAKPTMVREAKPSRLPLREADRVAQEAGLADRVASDKNEIAARHGSGLVDIPADVDRARFVADRVNAHPDFPTPQSGPEQTIPEWKRPNPQPLSVVENQQQTRARMLDEATKNIRTEMARAGVPENRSIAQQFEQENGGRPRLGTIARLLGQHRAANAAEMVAPTDRDVLSRFLAGKSPAEAVKILEAAQAARRPAPGSARAVLGAPSTGRAVTAAQIAAALAHRRRREEEAGQ